MFGLFKRGSRPKPPNYLVWQSNASRWEGIWKSIAGRTGDGRLLFLAHFDETLAMLHELLEQDGLVAETLTRPYQPSDLCKLPPGIYVARASRLERQGDNKDTTSNTPLKIIAVEPHLMPEPDANLRAALDSIRGDVLYEHHASLDDLPMRLFAGGRTLELLSKAGFKEGDCLDSGMVSRAIARAQGRLSETPGLNRRFASLAEWEAQFEGIDGR
ncbi:MAG: hypothetical protein KTR15_12385 [Phycisphaeraceae bacterium]|nr:hypothetical protein [Phycisphaeraceae bacterium]